MRCDEVKDLITIFLEGELEREKAEAVRAHIDSCQDCKSLMEDSLKVINTLRSMEYLPVPEGVVEGILKATKKKRKKFLIFPVLQPHWVFAFSVFVLSFFFFTSPKKTLFYDSIKFKAHITYSHIAKFASKVDGMIDYAKNRKLKSISWQKGFEGDKRLERGRKGGRRDMKNSKIILL